MNPALNSSKKHDWRTPEEILVRVRRMGPIVLDPCTSADNPTDALAFYTEADDGLARPWLARWRMEPTAPGDIGVIFVNPPYGRGIGKWTDKCAKNREVVALVPSRTDTAWFHRALDTATAVCFWRGRIRFVGAKAGAPFPSAFFYWGSFPSVFESAFRDAGKIWNL